MLYGITNFSFWGDLITLLILTHFTVMSVTLYLHRSQAHRGIDFHPVISHIFRFWLWLTTGMSTKAWTAIHRKHHAKCETESDPHSPQILGLKKVLFEGAELYQAEAKNEETLEKYGKGTPDDWIERNLYQRYGKSGLLLMFILDLVLFGLPGITMWALQMMWIPFFAAGIINGVGHFWGYRNFECKDASTNIVPWGVLLGGEELHNNHHAYASSAKFSMKWWEFDLGWAYISFLKAFRLAKVKRIAPKLHILPGKSTIDINTVKVIITNRLQVLSHYSKKVILPVLNEEKNKAAAATKPILSKVKKILLRESSLIDEKNKQQLVATLNENKMLNSVYQFRQQLQAIWEHTTASQKELLDALQEWCKQAEASGIKALEEFAATLKGFTVQTKKEA